MTNLHIMYQLPTNKHIDLFFIAKYLRHHQWMHTYPTSWTIFFYSPLPFSLHQTRISVVYQRRRRLYTRFDNIYLLLIANYLFIFIFHFISPIVVIIIIIIKILRRLGSTYAYPQTRLPTFGLVPRPVGPFLIQHTRHRDSTITTISRIRAKHRNDFQPELSVSYNRAVVSVFSQTKKKKNIYISICGH